MAVKQNIFDCNIHSLTVYSCMHLILIYLSCTQFIYLSFQEEQAKKKQETLEKKAESKALLEQEMKSIQTSGKQPLAKTTQAQIQVMYINTGCIIYQKNGVLLCWTTVFLTVSLYRTVTLQTHQYCYALWTVCNLLHIIFSHLSPIMSV